MVVYHVLYSMQRFYGVDVPIFFDDWFGIIRNIFAGTFIFISGTVCRFSRNNLKRGVLCFFLGMLITYVVTLAEPGVIIHFGILHLLGISMIIFALTEPFFDLVPPLPGMLVFGFLFFALFGITSGYIGFERLFHIELPNNLYTAGVLFPFGFIAPEANYSDYFPLLPWFCVFAAGCFFGVYARENRLPRYFYKPRVKFLATTGRYTIWIYLLHQPIAMAILNLIFRNNT
jgi:uncharacterized membrane protein